VRDIPAVLDLGDEELDVRESFRSFWIEVRLVRAVEPRATGFLEEGAERVGLELEVGVDEGDDGSVVREEDLGMVVEVELYRARTSVP
jgi:hypothetical protein